MKKFNTIQNSIEHMESTRIIGPPSLGSVAFCKKENAVLNNTSMCIPTVNSWTDITDRTFTGFKAGAKCVNKKIPMLKNEATVKKYKC